MDRNHLQKICTQFQLGSPDDEVAKINGSRGGSFIWRINTSKGSYAIKQLSPELDMQNEKIIAKYELSEAIAYRFARQGVAVVSAIEQSGKHLIIIENTGYLVYPWIDANTLDQNRLSKPHALKIAEILARLHKINMIVPDVGPPRFDIHTKERIVSAIGKAVSLKISVAKILQDNQDIILSINDSYIDAIAPLKEDTVISHGDLDQLNVLWDKAENPILIDWESVRRLNPTREIVRTSLGWSGIGTENFSREIYAEMLSTYHKAGGILNVKHISPSLYAVFGSMINWLLYNIELSCANEQERVDAAIKEIKSIILTMLRFKNLIPELVGIGGAYNVSK